MGIEHLAVNSLSFSFFILFCCQSTCSEYSFLSSDAAPWSANSTLQDGTAGSLARCAARIQRALCK